jgi:hypothetical protein
MMIAMVQIVDFFMLQRYNFYKYKEAFLLINSVNFNDFNKYPYI